ncbi:rhomboid family intramembrane serine protease [Psychrobacter sp. DM4]|uniref:rhomboid family intramembrane serine protease n=1 Tax=Psychrobacter sp. DM4 TaxID=3440637 RepID=UPI003F50D444
MTIQQLLKTAPISTLLLVGFIGLFIVQVLTGVDANNPSTEALLYWGANALPLTMVDDPWRLVSSAFLHIGLMHLLFNGFAMYFFGQVAEPMFGSAKFLALFLLAAIGGNLLNSQVTWQGILDGSAQPGLSAGASGGIMGIGAALLIAALFKISVNGMVLNLKSLILIMGINLVYGFAVPGIDNAGHIGGAITGGIIALGFAFAYRQRLAAQRQAIAEYKNHLATTTPQVIDHSHQPLNDIFSDNGSQIPVNLEHDSSNNPSHSYSVNTTTHPDNLAKVAAKPLSPKPIKTGIIWQLLPWLTMFIIMIGFVWWWQDIHNQILQVLAANE